MSNVVKMSSETLSFHGPALGPELVPSQRPPSFQPVARRRDVERRLSVWEVRGASPCSIVGTCLSLIELRKIARKTRFLDPKSLSDYDLHGHFTAQMTTDNAVSRAVTKHLDDKFEGAIRKARALDGDDAFMAFWEGSVEIGLAPGAYWAIVTHPRASLDVETRVYGEIHMMSHMSGASNRGDARAVAEMRREKGEVARRLSQRIVERDRRLAEAGNEIARLQARIRALEPLEARCERLRALGDGSALAVELRAREQDVAALQSENAALRRQCGAWELRLERLRARLEQLPARNVCFEAPRSNGAENEPDEPSADAPDLCGRCLLYVGGRPQTVCILRGLVARHNGRLLHHDGGLESSAARLSDLVRQADEVFFPVDCVSHSAMLAVKRVCESQGKALTALRTAGVTTFVRALAADCQRPSASR